MKARPRACRSALAGAGLDRDQPAVDHVEQHPVDVGQLLAGLVDPVEVRVALGHEAGRGRRVLQHPGLQRRQVRVVEAVHAIAPAVQLRPVARPVGLDQPRELVRVGVALVELLEVVGGRIDEQRARAGERRQEERVGLGPGIAHGALVQDLDLRPLAVDLELDRRPDRAELLVAGDVLPPVAEVLGGERRAVRPAVPLAQAHGEHPAVLDLDVLEDVRDQVELGVVADQAGVAVDHQQPRVAAYC